MRDALQKDVKFAVTPSGVVLETLTQQQVFLNLMPR